MKIVVTLCAVLLLASNATLAAETTYSIKFGFTNERPDEPDLVLQTYGGFIAYLDKKLEAKQIDVDMVVAKTIDDMRQKVQHGAVNVVSESLFSSLKLAADGSVQPLVLAWRKGIRSYQSLFVVRQDSPLTRIEELRGKTIVFESLRSTSAYAVPKAFLQQQGMSVFPADQADAPADAVKYTFTGDEMTQAYQVTLRRADAAAFGTNDWDETPGAVRNQLKIIERTPPMLRWLISTHRDMPAEVQSALQQALLGMSAAADAQSILQQSQLIRFETLTAEDQHSLEQTKALLGFIQ